LNTMNKEEFLKGIDLLLTDRRKASTACILKKMGYRRGRNLLERELKMISKVRIQPLAKDSDIDCPKTEVDKREPERVINSSSENKPANSNLAGSESGKETETKRTGPPLQRDKKVIIRETFPFLGEENCPDILKILVADMLSSHSRYIKGHGRLFDVAHKDGETCFRAAQVVVDNYIENRRIWAELDHYQKKGTLLGEHPLFDVYRKKEQLLKMNDQERSKYLESIRKKIWKRKEMIRENPEHERVDRWRDELNSLELEKKEFEKLKKSNQGKPEFKKKQTSK